MMMCSFSSTWLKPVLSAPIFFWLSLLELFVGMFMAVQLYRYWKIISDLRTRNDAIESERRHLEALTKSLIASKAVLQASIQDLRAENDRLEHRSAELTALQGEKDRLERQIVELTSNGPRLHGVWNNSQVVEPISVRPDLIEDEQVVLCMSPPIDADETCSFTASIVLEDHQNRLHTLPKHSFRPTEQAPPWLSENLTDVAF